MKLAEAEDRVKRFLDGGSCTDREHEPATVLEKMIMLKMLRLEYPHQSTAVSELDRVIRKEVKQHAEKTGPPAG